MHLTLCAAEKLPSFSKMKNEVIVSATRGKRGIKIPLFNIVINDHGTTCKSDFPVFHRKYPFSPKIKIVSLNSNSVPRLIQIFIIQCCC